MANQSSNNIKSVIHRFDQISAHLESSQERLDFFSSTLFADQMDIAVREIGSDGALISVDIFDTLLLRDSTSEIKRFSLIAEEQCKYLNDKYNFNCTQEDLLAARLSGTKISYRASKIVDGCREGSITDIYRVAARALNLPSSEEKELIQLELDHEKRVLTPNAGLIRQLRKHKKNGARCIMISDMYLHVSHIKELAGALIPDYIEIFDDIYSSADTTVSKSSQKIFPLIGEILNANPENWLHMGDAIKGDYRSPLNQKIKAIYLPIPLNIIEKREACEKATIAELNSKGLNPKLFNS
jgi:predicted HAD superfamily hydrolase